MASRSDSAAAGCVLHRCGCCRCQQQQQQILSADRTVFGCESSHVPLVESLVSGSALCWLIVSKVPSCIQRCQVALWFVQHSASPCVTLWCQSRLYACSLQTICWPKTCVCPACLGSLHTCVLSGRKISDKLYVASCAALLLTGLQGEEAQAFGLIESLSCKATFEYRWVLSGLHQCSRHPTAGPSLYCGWFPLM